MKTFQFYKYDDINLKTWCTICWCLRSFVIWVPFSSILMTNLSSSFCRSCLCVDCWVASISPTNSWYSLWKAGHHKLTERLINLLDFSHISIRENNTTLCWSFLANGHVTAMKAAKKQTMKRHEMTYKLICPSSSCRAKSRSDSEPSGWCFGSISPSCSWGCEEDEGKAFWRFFLIPCPDLCRAVTRSHSCGWWCFIMWSMLCMLAWTEWLGLVDWFNHKTTCPVRQLQNNMEQPIGKDRSYRSCDEGYFLVPRPNRGTHFWLWLLR